MRRALIAIALLSGLVGYGAGAARPAAADFLNELALWGGHSAVVFCDNWGEGKIEVQQLDEATLYVTCGGGNHDKNHNGIKDEDERGRGR
jgi:hypothetical protein